MAFLERAATTPFEFFELFEGYKMRRNGSYYLLEGDPFKFADETADRVRELETEVKAFARDGGDLHEAGFVALCTYRYNQRRQRLYLVPVDAVRPGATERIAQLYEAAAAAYDRENAAEEGSRTPPAAAWPPTHGPYVPVARTVARTEADQPLTECLRAFFPHASLSPEVQAAALQRAQRTERLTWERLEDLRLGARAGAQQARLSSTVYMMTGSSVVFYSAQDGWRGTSLQPSADQWMSTAAALMLNDVSLKNCGFLGNAGGISSLFEQACMSRISIDDGFSDLVGKRDFDTRAMLAMKNGFGLNEILTGYELVRSGRIEVQVRGDD
ncbi:hypothetical protein [Brevundimonas diminuta]|uniref:hypothetical protein n=1 Tax=Brevundimonas diminuta TaxID=293 RepID=UPI003D03457A